MSKLFVKYRLPNNKVLLSKGRDAWALLELDKADRKGCTPIDNPAPRWSAYIHNLRKCGLPIETIHEPHKGDFAGTHARYVLRTKIDIISIDGEER
ncbi:MAG: hypothetical protein JKY45_10090 [Emcibacter sp.]|nr:hypothetical protein [Emcibacter sp.]